MTFATQCQGRWFNSRTWHFITALSCAVCLPRHCANGYRHIRGNWPCESEACRDRHMIAPMHLSCLWASAWSSLAFNHNIDFLHTICIMTCMLHIQSCMMRLASSTFWFISFAYRALHWSWNPFYSRFILWSKVLYFQQHQCLLLGQSEPLIYMQRLLTMPNG